MGYVIEVLGIMLIIVGCVTSTVASNEKRKGWRLLGLTATGAGAVVVLNF